MSAIETMLAELRSEGGAVAIHNDYRMNGHAKTFWLFTHDSGVWIKGEGRDDATVLADCVKRARKAKARGMSVETHPLLADPVAAILFSLTLDDYYRARVFLGAWNEGDLVTLAEWPEFTGSRNDKETRK